MKTKSTKTRRILTANEALEREENMAVKTQRQVQRDEEILQQRQQEQTKCQQAGASQARLPLPWLH